MATAERLRTRIQSKQNKPDCFTGACSCGVGTALRKGLAHAIPRTAIYTKTDGIVDWQFCINADPATNFEVLGTHIGLAVNPLVISNRNQRRAVKPAFCYGESS